ncbi:MAG: hypothetical protein EA374_03945 [Acholeplasmatales bacterium]|nr:MAG: hypothetical protein EA374_03945 [Acholeplasmatales bacterium]
MKTPPRRYDARHLIFSRLALQKGTEAYESYYREYPKHQAEDDALRPLDFRQALRVDKAFKARFFPLTRQNHVLLQALHDSLRQQPLGTQVDVPEGFEKNLKAIAKHYGACDAGIVSLKEDHYYTHPEAMNTLLEKDGEPFVYKKRPTALVYAVEMDRTFINRAPHFEELLETENAYLKMAFIGARLALYLKQLGYDTVFQSEAYYETPLVPLAYDAGLGEIGMSNHLIHPRYGDRIRLGAVLTDLRLPADAPIDFGLEDFCKRCALCLMNCPSKSIKHQPRDVLGRRFYKFDDLTCYTMWTRCGTDCGTCIQSCPFTQGIPYETLAWMKNHPSRIDTVIENHLAQHGRRAYQKSPLDIILKEEVKP